MKSIQKSLLFNRKEVKVFTFQLNFKIKIELNKEFIENQFAFRNTLLVFVFVLLENRLKFVFHLNKVLK